MVTKYSGDLVSWVTVRMTQSACHNVTNRRVIPIGREYLGARWAINTVVVYGKCVGALVWVEVALAILRICPIRFVDGVVVAVKRTSATKGAVAR